ncbi:hypothetical protein GS527_15515 [Leptospira borgpetersenii]|uniref:Uncharacterized protein n=1 Tax=Leptospira borgpetersenii serovar Ballum TaxID=280505 RepID=A0A0S2IVN5_LEPBO|nr:hypothetical protein LBBP_03485 [Leptospira borgpetersenii serovar Ballum]QHE34766.1 hypothetical protein GS517_15205 [Leptospira borgpetersenii]OOV46327.1 hypothetical protein B1H38_00585 [Leptospira borgpetersenii serovar Ballum]QHE37999.1 hypothetical protein GS510_14855 [Leptospira borgpetersenii]QHE41365.1 hypothetical protein GS527_15515 [Leptospira borgpetersenii]
MKSVRKSINHPICENSYVLLRTYGTIVADFFSGFGTILKKLSAFLKYFECTEIVSFPSSMTKSKG